MNKSINISEIKEYFQLDEGINDFLYYHYSSDNLLTMLTPSRINGFSAGICMKGEIDISIGINRTKINKDNLIFTLPGQIIQIHKISKDVELHTILISSNFTDSLNVDTSRIFNPYFYMEDNPVLMIRNKEAKELMLTFYSVLNNLGQFSSQPFYKEIVQHTVYAFLFGVGTIYEQFYRGRELFSPDKRDLLKSFFSLLQKHFKNERSVEFFAEKLYLTPKYLSSYIKKVSGRTAKEWICEIIILEAKVLLRNPKTTIQQIGEELNFTDQSTFGKFFKKHEGISPKEYRIKINMES